MSSTRKSIWSDKQVVMEIKKRQKDCKEEKRRKLKLV